MFYVLDENNNKVEAFDKQGVLAVLAQAISDGSLNNIVADSAFVSKLKCCVGGDTFKVAFVTQAKYNELEANNLLERNTYYYITDDDTANNLDELLTQLTNAVNENSKEFKRLDAEVAEHLYQYGIDHRLLEKSMNDIEEIKTNINNSVQEINGFNSTDLIYDSSQSDTNQPRVDITSLMRTGKMAKDTIGMAGTLQIYIDNIYRSVRFNGIWSSFTDYNNGSSSASTECCVYYQNNDKFYLLTFSVGIATTNENSKLFCLDMKCKDLINNSNITIAKVRPSKIVIHYK